MMKRNRISAFIAIVALGYTLAMPALDASPGKKTQPTISLTATISNPTLLAGKTNTTFLRISLDGATLSTEASRPPINVAIVIDKSSSMSGQRIEQAKLAAIAAVERLRDNDIVSIVLYDSAIEVLVPSTKATDRAGIVQKLRAVQVGSNTALFAGVAAGAAEVRKFIDRGNINRVILLSDGQANVGPSSPNELADLGRSLAKENISVSTLGIGEGYNEDLMMQLAATSSGNHVFIEDEASLVAIFNREFDTLMSIVASDIQVQVALPNHVRPVRVLGTEARIDGRDIFIPLTQLYSGQNRYFIIELEIDSCEDGSHLPIANVSAAFTSTMTEQRETRSVEVLSRFTSSLAEVESETDLETLAYATVLVTTERNRLATALRDAGKVDEAKDLLRINGEELLKCSEACEAKNIVVVVPILNANSVANGLQESEIADDAKWKYGRKRMVEFQNRNVQQQVYDGLDNETTPSNSNIRK